MKVEISRRSVLRLFGVGSVLPTVDSLTFGSSQAGLAMNTSADFLTATLKWDYPTEPVRDQLLPCRGVLHTLLSTSRVVQQNCVSIDS